MSISDDEDFDYEFLEPPEEEPHVTRFGEGQPTNLGGRPKGSPNQTTMARRVANKRHRVTIDGRARRMSTIELVLLSIKKKAATGNVAAFNLAQSLLSEHASARGRRQAVLIVGNKLTNDEWEMVYGLHTTDEETMEICPYLLPMRRREQARRREAADCADEVKQQYEDRARLARLPGLDGAASSATLTARQSAMSGEDEPLTGNV